MNLVAVESGQSEASDPDCIVEFGLFEAFDSEKRAKIVASGVVLEARQTGKLRFPW